MKIFFSSQNPLLKLAAILSLSVTLNLFTPNTAKTQTVSEATLSDALTQIILQQAAEDTSLSISELQIETASRVTWPNGCMGISGPEIFCTQAFVDGWIVVITSGSNQWTYHTNGSRVLLNDSLPNRQPTEQLRWEEWQRQLEQRRRQEEWRRRWANIGWTQDNPVMPTVTEPGTWIFDDVPSGRWVDPPTAYGFRYTMLEDSLFTDILDFPIAIDDDNLFTISVGDTILGEFSPGESVNFVSLLGHGVSEFAITDINPLVDPEDPSAFPLKIAFNTEQADFKMEAIPAPTSVPEGSTSIALLAFGALGIYSRFKGHGQFN
ncbi:hypothetical protein [Phormidium sp. CCY1219]|uniref:hypothetical protein n=1 Tax=Phormidium sp. CCY1219 TaxID=2886104 RepID=UPI002D1F8649|nr:hypothetical protein [Phormidium sp. CCY1219]MEB3827006.1 hypothetical protein [Phormidium sp. CCY1219]